MRTCPSCGETVGTGEASCGVCGAAMPPRRSIGIYVLSGAALLAIIAAAAFLHSYLQPRVTRAPIDFLPATTRAVIALDLRASSSGAQLVNANWSRDDVAALSDRAEQLAQMLVDMTGLQLDLREEAARWFGGELLVASIGGISPPLGPRSLVLIARITELRQARRDLDRAVEKMAEEAGWRRMVVRSDGRAITVWGEPGGESAIAYAALEGCLLVSANDEVIESCLRTAANPSDGLTEAVEFKEIYASLPKKALFWSYVSADEAFDAARYLLPKLRRGWGELLRAYLGRTEMTAFTRQKPTDRATSSGSLGLALIPEKDGVRLSLNYRRAGGRKRTTVSDTSSKLFTLLPREAAGYALIRDLPSLVTPSRPPAKPGRFYQPWGLFPFLPFQYNDLPDSLMLTMIPSQTSGHRPRVAAALEGKGAAQTGLWLSKLIPNTMMYEADGVTVLTRRLEVFKAMEGAASDPVKRLEVKVEPDTRLQAWARPEQLSPAFHGIGEIEIKLLDNAKGAQGEIYIKAEPRYLLGSF